MAIQTVFPKVLARLQTLSGHLRQLRSTLQGLPHSMPQQIGNLQHIHRKLQAIRAQLQAIEEMVILKFGRNRQPSSYWNYLVLIELLEQMQHLTCSLMHLTEEYLIDPIGVQSCLQTEINFDVLELQNRFKQLTATDHAHLASRTPKDSAA